jgi:hypothetical protein
MNIEDLIDSIPLEKLPNLTLEELKKISLIYKIDLTILIELWNECSTKINKNFIIHTLKKTQDNIKKKKKVIIFDEEEE